MGLFRQRTVKELADRGNVRKLVEFVRCDTSSQIRSEAVNALCRIAGQDAIEGLVLALKDSNHRVREVAERGLSEMVDRLLAALKDAHSDVKEEAESALRQMVGRLVQALKDSDLIGEEPGL